MKQQVSPVVFGVVIVAVLIAVVVFFLKGIAPHEKVISNPNAKIGFEGRLEKLRAQQGKSGAPMPNVPAGPNER